MIRCFLWRRWTITTNVNKANACYMDDKVGRINTKLFAKEPPELTLLDLKTLMLTLSVSM